VVMNLVRLAKEAFYFLLFSIFSLLAESILKIIGEKYGKAAYFLFPEYLYRLKM
jgi:hypothetical protein